MIRGKVIFTKTTQQGKELVIRYPKRTDAKGMCDYINTLSKERTFIRSQGEKITLEEERAYLRGQLTKMKDRQAVQLLVFLDDRLVGIAGVNMKDKIESHIGSLGISLDQKIRGEGIGTLLMDVLLRESKKYLPTLKTLILSVFGQNKRALSLYKKFGFTEYGKLPEGVRFRNLFDDQVLMYKKIR